MKNWYKYTIAFLAVFAIRLMPFRAPNLEPVMSFVMPMGKKYGKYMAFLFGFLSIFIFDSITSGIGLWTMVPAVTYGLVGFGAYFYFKNRSGRKNYVIYAIVATIIYDVVTGLIMGPILFGQSFTVALVGQVPFTAIHLLGNVSFAIVLSPVIEKWLVKESVIMKATVMVEKTVKV